MRPGTTPRPASPANRARARMAPRRRPQRSPTSRPRTLRGPRPTSAEVRRSPGPELPRSRSSQATIARDVGAARPAPGWGSRAARSRPRHAPDPKCNSGSARTKRRAGSARGGGRHVAASRPPAIWRYANSRIIVPMIAPIRPPRSNASLSPIPSSSVKMRKPDQRARETQQDGHEEAAGILPGHECFPDESCEQSEYECSDHAPGAYPDGVDRKPLEARTRGAGPRAPGTLLDLLPADYPCRLVPPADCPSVLWGVSSDTRPLLFPSQEGRLSPRLERSKPLRKPVYPPSSRPVPVRGRSWPTAGWRAAGCGPVACIRRPPARSRDATRHPLGASGPPPRSTRRRSPGGSSPRGASSRSAPAAPALSLTAGLPPAPPFARAAASPFLVRSASLRRSSSPAATNARAAMPPASVPVSRSRSTATRRPPFCSTHSTSVPRSEDDRASRSRLLTTRHDASPAAIVSSAYIRPGRLRSLPACGSISRTTWSKSRRPHLAGLLDRLRLAPEMRAIQAIFGRDARVAKSLELLGRLLLLSAAEASASEPSSSSGPGAGGWGAR